MRISPCREYPVHIKNKIINSVSWKMCLAGEILLYIEGRLGNSPYFTVI